MVEVYKLQSLCPPLASCRVIHLQRTDINRLSVVAWERLSHTSFKPLEVGGCFWEMEPNVRHTCPEHPKGVNRWHVWWIWPTVRTGRPSCFKEVLAYLGNVQAGSILLEGQMMDFNKKQGNWSRDFILETLPFELAINGMLTCVPPSSNACPQHHTTLRHDWSHLCRIDKWQKSTFSCALL